MEYYVILSIYGLKRLYNCSHNPVQPSAETARIDYNHLIGERDTIGLMWI